jgi:hypothetical protein
MDLQSCLAAGIHLAMGLPLAVALAAAVGWTCWVLAVRLLPLAPASVRLAGAISAAIWLCQASFFLLSLAGAFRPWCALALWCFAAALANQLAGRDALDQLRSDLRRAAAVVREVLGSRYRWIVLAALVLVSLLDGTASSTTWSGPDAGCRTGAGGPSR